MSKPVQCFISYAHNDHVGFDRLHINLKPIADLYNFDIWFDRRINPGNYWRKEIEAQIKKSNIFICLVTNDFFASDYIRNYELPAMIEKYLKENSLLVPIIYKESAWRRFFGNYIEVIPKDQRHRVVPVYDWRDREKALATAANAISTAIEDWFGVKPKDYFNPVATRELS